MASDEEPAAPPRRVVRPRRDPLHGRLRIPFERKLKLWLWCFAVPVLAGVWSLCLGFSLSRTALLLSVTIAALIWWLVTTAFLDGIFRPLQTLTNIVSALRENDFAFRARGAARGDVLGDLALEINRLAAAMQLQRDAALDALTLADRVISSMPSPVLAFDDDRRVRLLNVAAERTFHVTRGEAVGRLAHELGMEQLMTIEAGSVLATAPSGTAPGTPHTRWSVQRSTFRLHGVPHTLLTLSDIGPALREEERLAWQRLIRVLSHEINNSLTPIKSVAGMLRSRPLHLSADFHTSQDLHDLRRGLAMIEDRAESLNRFLQAYQQLSRLPLPQLRPTLLSTVVEQSVLLERRVPIQVTPSPPLQVEADPDQLQQLLINVLKNAAEATMESGSPPPPPPIQVRWQAHLGTAILCVMDHGPGLSNPSNLFVPFYTTKPDGTGVGLTLCQQIVSAHHGTITLQNRPDAVGCMVEIRLPLLQVSSRESV